MQKRLNGMELTRMRVTVVTHAGLNFSHDIVVVKEDVIARKAQSSRLGNMRYHVDFGQSDSNTGHVC